MAEPADDELVILVQQRDQAAFGRLVARHLTSVHRYLARLTDSPADADELAQETFLRLWERADSYRPGRVKLATWLHRVAHNLAMDELRRRARWRTVSDGDGPDSEPPRVPTLAADPVGDPEALAVSGETDRRLQAALAALPAGQRAAVLLCQVQGFSNREAAAILRVSVRSLESLVARARRALRTSLLDDVPEHDRGEDRS